MENNFLTFLKNKTTGVEIFFVTLFLNGNEQGAPPSRHVRSAPLPPLSRGVTCEVQGGGSIVQR